jgi:hypothetical protein
VSRLDVTYLVAGVCALIGIGAFLGLILVPAVTAYQRTWQRLIAGVLSLYVLAAMVGVGLLGAYGLYELWIRYG